jgi:transposase
MLRGLAKEIPRMRLTMTETQRIELEVAAAAEKNVRRWRRYQAVLLQAEGQAPVAIAHTLRCSRASVYHWAVVWRQAGVAGLREGDHGGGRSKVDAAGEAVLTNLLATDPQTRGHQATGWTVPLLRTELEQAGAAVAPKTVRRALHRLGYRWKRPQYVLGRPDPAYDEEKGR